jgi:hypothetical protein
MDFFVIATKPIEATVFGLVGDGTTADDVAMTAAVNAATAMKRPLRLPASCLIRLTVPLVLPNADNVQIEGQGVSSTVFVIDPAVPGTDGFQLLPNLRHHRYSGFSVWGRSTNPAGNIWSLSSNPTGGTGHRWTDVNLGSPNGSPTAPEYRAGWWLDGTGGQNSEMSWEGCWASRYAVCGWQGAGLEQYDLTVKKCAMNGGWDGVTACVGGGQFGVWSQGAGFHIVDCFGGAHSNSDFQVAGFNGQPFAVENWNSERSWGLYNAYGPLSSSGGSALISFRRCRATYGPNFAPDGVVKFSGNAGLAVEECYLRADGTPVGLPLIAIAPASAPKAISIAGNRFQTVNSASVDPLLIAPALRSYISCHDNTFTDSAGNLTYRSDS